MSKYLRFAIFPSWLWVMPLLAPTHVTIDTRPAVRSRIISTQARFENCAALKNPGCLKFAGQPGATRGRNGYARFSSLENGYRALYRWWDRRGCAPVGKSLGRYNPSRADYAAVILGAAGVRGDEVIGECR